MHMVHHTISSYCINKTAGIFSLTFFIIIKTYGTRPVKKTTNSRKYPYPRPLLGGVVFAGPARGSAEPDALPLCRSPGGACAAIVRSFLISVRPRPFSFADSA